MGLFDLVYHFIHISLGLISKAPHFQYVYMSRCCNIQGYVILKFLGYIYCVYFQVHVGYLIKDYIVFYLQISGGASLYYHTDKIKRCCIYGLMQERHNSIANALELRLPCANP